MTTDHPNGSPFVNYPEVITLLMSKPKRDAEMATLHEQVPKRTTLGRHREGAGLDGYRHHDPCRSGACPGIWKTKDIWDRALTRMSPSTTSRPEEVDTSLDHALVKKALATAKYTIKGGVVVSKEGQILATPPGRTFWVDAAVPQADTDRLMVDLEEKFAKYYSVQISNYAVQDAYLPHAKVIRAGLATSLSRRWLR